MITRNILSMFLRWLVPLLVIIINWLRGLWTSALYAFRARHDIIFLLRFFGLRKTLWQLRNLDEMQIIIRTDQREWQVFGKALSAIPDRVVVIVPLSSKGRTALELSKFRDVFHCDACLVKDIDHIPTGSIEKASDQQVQDAESSSSTLTLQDKCRSGCAEDLQPAIQLSSDGEFFPKYYITCQDDRVQLKLGEIQRLFDFYGSGQSNSEVTEAPKVQV